MKRCKTEQDCTHQPWCRLMSNCWQARHSKESEQSTQKADVSTQDAYREKKESDTPRTDAADDVTMRYSALYVYAHVRDVLKHVCDNCGAKHSIVNLNAKQTRKGRLPKRRANG